MGGIQRTRYLFDGNFGRYPVSAVPFGRYSFVDGTFWAVSRVVGTLLAVLFGGIFLAEAIKPKYGGIFSAVGDITKMWR